MPFHCETHGDVIDVVGYKSDTFVTGVFCVMCLFDAIKALGLKQLENSNATEEAGKEAL